MTQFKLEIVHAILSFAVYFATAFCINSIASKGEHHREKWWAWVPILNLALIAKLAGKHLSWAGVIVVFPLLSLFVLAIDAPTAIFFTILFVPLIVGSVVYYWLGACMARNLGARWWVGVFAVIPVWGLPFLSYLAFSHGELKSQKRVVPVIVSLLLATVFSIVSLKSVLMNYVKKVLPDAENSAHLIHLTIDSDGEGTDPKGYKSVVLNGISSSLPLGSVSSARLLSAPAHLSKDGIIVLVELKGGKKIYFNRSGPDSLTDLLHVQEKNSFLDRVGSPFADWALKKTVGARSKNFVDVYCEVVSANLSDITCFSSPRADVLTVVRLLMKYLAVPSGTECAFLFDNEKAKGLLWFKSLEHPFYLCEFSEKNGGNTGMVALSSFWSKERDNFLSSLSVQPVEKGYAEQRFQESLALASRQALTHDEKIQALLSALEAVSNGDNPAYERHLLSLYEKYGLRNDLRKASEALSHRSAKGKSKEDGVYPED